MYTNPQTATNPAGATTVLVANRGEIAVRIMRTLRRLGMRSVAIHSDGDPDARHVHAADTAVRVGGADLADSYLNGAAIIDAALTAGAGMVHPGYGFLSENAGFGRACAEAGLVFVGPPAAAIDAMGDKIRAKSAVAAAGVPLLPGFAEEPDTPMDEDQLARAAAEVGYPLLIKPSAGGGGKGMRLVRTPVDLAAAAAAARREARAAFGDATLLVERFVERPRHIEIQVLADTHGNVVHLGERECSLQRRHQKIVEEAPSPLLTADQRTAMGEAAVAAAKACGYVGAGTVEFIVQAGDAGGAGDSTAKSPSPLDYSFLEMNTRLQVEHPITEAVATVAGQRGVDLVELQLRVAKGDPLSFSQADIGMSGHAVESRVYAEDPARDFLPTGGRVLLLSEPEGSDVRVDSGVDGGAEITSAYDPMLAKVVTWGPDRAAALDRMDTALAEYTLLGCTTNVGYLRRLLRHPRVVSADLSTDLIELVHRELLPEEGEEVPDELYAAAALDRQLDLEPAGPAADRFDVPDGWRIGAPAWTMWRLRAPRLGTVAVAIRRSVPPDAPHRSGALDYEVRVGDSAPVPARASRSADGRRLAVSFGGHTVHYARAADDSSLWLGHEGGTWQLLEEPAFAPIRERESAVDGTVRSPMPGTVLSVLVEQGRHVAAGTPVAVVEAMKMEHTVTSPIDGVVARVDAHPGRSVALDTVLAAVTPEPAEPPPGSAEPATHEE
ncbi:acetyl/propionyl/methylcrotonyl-CoA carboxylase subunit alpha [Allosalinactinospora lopnorensis]|uniref:acetyl/propionyl/methylcrotonyl-CoA carboxylase subunit alpha n=1 Tax=Allosalinactinospora lopnorensis TaxID=1352348 RepID=UPI000623D136|nr:biotin carboxylase N-terminal domain-containing protein [Allosalinactinospora lopnorensis]